MLIVEMKTLPTIIGESVHQSGVKRNNETNTLATMKKCWGMSFYYVYSPSKP